MSLLWDHWRKLSGSVHPDDVATFARFPGHSFNLDFPPPAFVGNLDAPIVLLMANGGYKPGVTESEFAEPGDVAAFLAYMRGERAALPTRLSAYYQRGAVGGLVAGGDAVIVNAVPYRSSRLSQEPINREIASLLP